MSVATAPESSVVSTVGMAQIAVLAEGEIAKALLGSCIGLCLHDPTTYLSAVAHVMLPDGDGREGAPGKFADTAVHYMMDRLVERGAMKTKIVAKMAGGAKMFQTTGPIEIGVLNQEAVKAMLAHYRIPILGEHLGGKKGRRILFDGTSGQLSVDVAGDEHVVV